MFQHALTGTLSSHTPSWSHQTRFPRDLNNLFSPHVMSVSLSPDVVSPSGPGQPLLCLGQQPAGGSDLQAVRQFFKIQLQVLSWTTGFIHYYLAGIEWGSLPLIPWIIVDPSTSTSTSTLTDATAKLCLVPWNIDVVSQRDTSRRPLCNPSFVYGTTEITWIDFNVHILIFRIWWIAVAVHVKCLVWLLSHFPS